MVRISNSRVETHLTFRVWWVTLQSRGIGDGESRRLMYHASDASSVSSLVALQCVYGDVPIINTRATKISAACHACKVI